GRALRLRGGVSPGGRRRRRPAHRRPPARPPTPPRPAAGRAAQAGQPQRPHQCLIERPTPAPGQSLGSAELTGVIAPRSGPCRAGAAAPELAVLSRSATVDSPRTPSAYSAI